jgi:hypothetical protein
LKDLDNKNVMSKLIDNELNDLWFSLNNKEVNSMNIKFSEFLKKIGIYEIRNSEILSTRIIDEFNYIVLTHKTINENNFCEEIYCYVVIKKLKDLCDVIKYSRIKNINFDIFNVISDYKISNLINNFNNILENKFNDFVINNFSFMNYKISQSVSLQFLIKPNRVEQKITKPEIVINKIPSGLSRPSVLPIKEKENKEIFSFTDNKNDNFYQDLDIEDAGETESSNNNTKINNVSSEFAIPYNEPIELTDVDDLLDSLTISNTIKGVTITNNNLRL